VRDRHHDGISDDNFFVSGWPAVLSHRCLRHVYVGERQEAGQKKQKTYRGTMHLRNTPVQRNAILFTAALFVKRGQMLCVGEVGCELRGWLPRLPFHSINVCFES
jgi:hypothetical protein